MKKLTRRQFMALSGKAATGAVIFVACGLPERELIVQSPIGLPEDLVRGEDAWYATTWGDVPGGDGLIVRVMQGRAKKVAGNPDFPVNSGKQSVRHDAALQLLYHPDRISRPYRRRSKGGILAPITWAEAEAELSNALGAASEGMTVVTNPLRGHLGWVTQQFSALYGGRHVTFDPVEQGVLHRAVEDMFGQTALPDLDIGRAQSVLSFGADWLSTWVSPVGMSVKYGQFRGQDHRGYLTHVEPRMSMTAAAADLWIAPKPGTEGAVALGIAKQIIDHGWSSASEISAFQQNMPEGALDDYNIEAVAERTGVPADRILKAAEKLGTNRPAVAFGGGSAGAHTNGSFNLRAIYSLNYLLGAVGAEGGVRANPGSPLEGVPSSATGATFSEWESELAQWRAGNVGTVIVRGADIVHGMPASVDVKGALNSVPRVIAFATVLDDTAGEADLVIPETSFLESWGTDIPEPGPGYQTVAFQQPVVGPTVNLDESALIADARSFGDVLLWASGGALGVRTMEDLVRNASGQLFDLGRRSGSVNAPDKGLFMNGVLQRGGWWDTGETGDDLSNVTPTVVRGTSIPAYSGTVPEEEGREFNLVPFQSNALLDGRLASTPWAQQSPDPMSSAVWDTWAEISKKDAEELNIIEGEVLFVRSINGEIEALAYPHPGVPPGIIGIPMGQGHSHGGRYAEGRGYNVLSIIAGMKDTETGALAWAATKVRVSKSGRRRKVPKFEGTVEAFPIEPGVPVLVVGPGETAHDAQEANHHLHQQSIYGGGKE